jgi:hypothetical protein
LDVNLRKKLLNRYVWSIALCGAGMWTQGSRLEMYRKYYNLALEKGEGDNLDVTCERNQEERNHVLSIKRKVTELVAFRVGTAV